MRYLCLVSVTLAALLHAGAASAQMTSATLRGRVHDAQGATISGASISVSDRANRIARTVVTDGAGDFVVPNLPPGTVNVTVTAAGFGPATRPVVLEIAQVARVDFVLAVGTVKETITVEASPVAVDTTRSVVDAVMPSSFISALPLNGRNFLELAFLVPGNAPAPNFDPTKSSTVTISSAGQLGRGGGRSLRGAHKNDHRGRGPLPNNPPGAGRGVPDAADPLPAG